MLDGDIVISHRLGLILRAVQSAVQVRAHIFLAAAAHLRELLNQSLALIEKGLFLYSHLRDEACNQGVRNRQQSAEQMLFVNLLVAVLARQLLRCGNRFLRFLCKLADIHALHLALLYCYTCYITFFELCPV